MVRPAPGETRLSWDPVLDRADLKPDVLALRDALSDAVEEGHWAHVATLLDRTEDDLPSALSANAFRAGDDGGMAPLHHAASQGAHPDVVDDLVARGAWRTLRSGDGETAEAIARRLGHRDLVERLRPELAVAIDDETLTDLEIFLWALVDVRTWRLGRRLRPPQLGPLLEHPEATMWIAVSGMYGGFACRWAEDTTEPTLEVRSGSRVAGGSGRAHHISGEGIELVTRGLV
ncbi:ankyrin repeat domain-containing protein [Actinomycetospora cinnamomea]|uniref:Uncharacterized protein n=1 Tax=Actinomycetospora cinnamomea TaxID=663609 RepID=A0A2U1E8Y2_9PSEU|nr:ankyrin repeat domain-containing protein [Actinomycetospora cinnamomea]PVY96335.1 hypothetical protein C8D89_13124 [Actinomycetospora cinnamomea]